MSIDKGETLKLFREIGKQIVTSIKRNFQEGGRPNKWKDSRRGAKYTKGKKGKTLIKTGLLRDKIHYKIIGSTIKVGTNMVYGAIHHFGLNKTVEINKRTDTKIYAKMMKQMNIKGNKSITSTKWDPTYKRKICMPARPFMMIQEEDKAIIMQMIAKYMKKIIEL